MLSNEGNAAGHSEGLVGVLSEAEMVIVCDGPINLFLSALYKPHDYLNKRPSAQGRRLCALVLGTGFRVSPQHILPSLMCGWWILHGVLHPRCG